MVRILDEADYRRRLDEAAEISTAEEATFRGRPRQDDRSRTCL
jgi:hypothetical protein